jgi:hypothetical protein
MRTTRTLRPERINNEAVHTVLEVFEAQSYDHAATQIETRTVGRIHRVKPSPRNWRTDATSFCNQGGYAFLIKFSTRHALPLGQPRISWSLNSRGEDAAPTRDGRTSGTRCPRHIPIAGAGHCQTAISYSPWTRITCVHGQSMSTFSPRPRSHPYTVRTHGCATISTFRKQSVEAGADCPRSVRVQALSTPTFSLRTETIPVHVRVWSGHCPQDA